MNEPVKNRITVYEVERFCERLHKLVIEAHPSLGEPSFSLETGTLRVRFPLYEASVEAVAERVDRPSFNAADHPPGATLGDVLFGNQPAQDSLEQALETQTAVMRQMVDEAPAPKPRKSKKVPQ